MSKKFEFKLYKKNMKLNLENLNVNKITLKLIGIYDKKKSVLVLKLLLN